MPDVEINIPEALYMEFERLAESEFLSKEEAVEELLSMGIEAYASQPTDDLETDLADQYADEMWDTADDTAYDERDTDSF